MAYHPNWHKAWNQELIHHPNLDWVQWAYNNRHNYKFSLLNISNWIKKHPETFNQPQHSIWRLLNNKVRNINFRLSVDKYSDVYTKIFKTPFHHNTITQTIEPQYNLKSYYTSLSQQWYNPKSPGFKLPKLIWCSISKQWWHKDYIASVYSLSKKKNLKVYKYIGCNAKSKLITKCNLCKQSWLKQYIKLNSISELNLCPTCIAKPRLLTNTAIPISNIIQRYHTHSDWNFIIQRQNHKDLSISMGIELEMHLKSNNINHSQSILWNLTKKQQELNPLWNNFYFETDGSLGDAGVEMITNPMTLKFHQRFWEFILPLIRKDFSAWYSHKYGGGDHSYGIHITVNGIHWREINIARLGNFFTNYRNKTFLYAIAQRASLYKGFSLGTQQGQTKDQFNITPEKNLQSKERNQPIHLKENGHIELRPFASTLNTGSFLKNLEFVDAMHRWCKETPYSIYYGHFLAWLNNQNPATYPNLMLYLSHDKFMCKQVGIVQNKWKHLLQYNLIGQLQLIPNIPIAAGISMIDDSQEDRAECA